MLMGLPQTGQVGTSSLGMCKVALLLDHGLDGVVVVIGALVAGLRALEQAVVALRVEEPLLVEARALELVVHVGREHEVVLVAYDFEQVAVGLAHGAGVAVVPHVARPECPALLGRGVGVEAARIHVGIAVALAKVAKEPLEALARVGKLGSAGGGEARSRAYQHGVGLVDAPRELLSAVREGRGRLQDPLA